MNIKSITYEFMGEQADYCVIIIGDTFERDNNIYVISDIREVGNSYNIYIKKITKEKDIIRFKSNPKALKAIEEPECVLYSIRATNVLIEYFIS